MRLTSPGTLAALALLLSGCGLIPLPESRPADFSFINSLEPGELKPGMVAYMEENQFEFARIPELPYRNMTVEADLTYRGQAPRLRLQLFASAMKPDCPRVPSRRPGYGAALLCDGPGGGTVVAEAALRPGDPVPVLLRSPELDRAARARSLYLGVRLLEGQTTPDERVDVRNMVVRGRL